MEYKDLFYNRLIELNCDTKDSTELFSKIAKRLLEEGFVNEGYYQGIVSREKEFPTGLITQHVNIALPHSDPEYIIKPFVFIVRNNNPISVKQMGDNQDIEVKDFFFLGINDPSNQVGLLQSFMKLFMSETFVSEYLHSNNQDELYNLFIDNI